MTPRTASSDLYDRAKTVMPGGCSRTTILRSPHPIYVREAKGCVLTDIEGVERLDFANNVASLIHGHAHPAILEAVSAQLAKGTAFSVGTEIEVVFAEQMVARSASFERIRFVNSGTEAVMACIKAARAFTSKEKIAKVEGAYHGTYDYAEISQNANPENWGDPESPARVPVARGTPQGVLDDVIILPFNEIERAVGILDRHQGAVAGILLDLVPHRIGVIPARPDFVAGLRTWATAHKALLIADEVITFRTRYDGAQGAYDGPADLTALGKMIGGGFPVGAVTGRADVMDVMNPLHGPARFPHFGTFNANPITMTAGSTAMKIFDRSAVIRLNALADAARNAIEEAIAIADVPACVSGRGSMFRIHFKEQVPTSYRSAFVGPKEQICLSAFLNDVCDRGLLMIPSGAGVLSTAMTADHVDRMAQIMLDGFRKVRPLV